jgi:hypothetical protein
LYIHGGLLASSKKLIKESKINKILIDTIKIDSISKIKLINSN